MANVDDLIKEVAIRHGVAIQKGDPVLILHTINEMLLRNSVEAQEKAFAAFNAELERVLARIGVEATDAAERTLGASMNATKLAMSGVANEQAKQVAAVIDAAATKAVAASDIAARSLRPIAWMAAGSAVVSVLAALLALVLVAR